MSQDRGFSARLRALAVGEAFTELGTILMPAWALARRWHNAAAALRHNHGSSLRIRGDIDRKGNTVTITRMPDRAVDPNWGKAA